METTASPPAAGAVRAGFLAWLKGSAGAALVRNEREQFDSILPGLFGYHIVQIGQYDGCALAAAARIRNKTELWLEHDGESDRRCTLLAQAASLPFAAHSIDVVVLPHVLEYAPDPDAALAETERVLVEDGHLIVTGFSPWSLWGLCRLNPFWRKRSPWNGRFYSATRLRQWLSGLHFEVLEVRRFLFRPPCQGRNLLRRLLFPEKSGAICWPLPGAAYVMVAQKRRAPLSPARLNAPRRIFLSGVSAGQATMTQADRQAMVRCRT